MLKSTNGLQFHNSQQQEVSIHNIWWAGPNHGGSVYVDDKVWSKWHVKPREKRI